MSAGTRPRPRSLARRKPSLGARIRPFWILGSFAAIVLVAAGLWLAQAPWFRIARVDVSVPIGSPVARDEVRAVARVQLGSNIWLLHPGRIARAIEAIPYVDNAAVGRTQFPQPTVDVSITVRRPTACVRSRDGVATIDASWRVLQAGCALHAAAWIDARAATVPAPGGSIDDPDLAHLLADAKLLADANLDVRSLGRDPWGGLVAVDATGVTLQFGDDTDLAKKAALVMPVRAGVGSARPIRAIDLRAPQTPVVDFR
jgi:hypothetical protein